jgi:hypothetical protein
MAPKSSMCMCIDEETRTAPQKGIKHCMSLIICYMNQNLPSLHQFKNAMLQTSKSSHRLIPPPFGIVNCNYLVHKVTALSPP